MRDAGVNHFHDGSNGRPSHCEVRQDAVKINRPIKIRFCGDSYARTGVFAMLEVLYGKENVDFVVAKHLTKDSCPFSWAE